MYVVALCKLHRSATTCRMQVTRNIRLWYTMIIKARRGDFFLTNFSNICLSINRVQIKKTITKNSLCCCSDSWSTGFTSVVIPHKNLSQQIQFKSKRPEVFPLFFSRFLKLAHFFQIYTHVIDITSFWYDGIFFYIKYPCTCFTLVSLINNRSHKCLYLAA